MRKLFDDNRETNLRKDWKEYTKNIKKHFGHLGKTKFIVAIKKKIKKEAHSNVKFSQKQIIISVFFTLIFAMSCGVYIGMKTFKEEIVVNNTNNDTYIQSFIDAYNALIDNYYGTVDKAKLIDGAIGGMSSTLGDPYTAYLNQSATDTFNIRINGEYKGIGVAMLRVDKDVAITTVFANSPASKIGLKVGDKIISIDDKFSSNITVEELSRYIRGSDKDTFALVIQRGDQTLNYTITREMVTLPSITKEVFTHNGTKTGYIKIDIFASNTAQQFKEALDSLEKDGIKSLVIDVRDNSGGYMNIATDIISTFLKRDAIILGTEKNGNVTYKKDQTDEYRSYKVAVLINGNSASASEILAAALKESYNAEIVGTKSYGKGTVQKPVELPNGGLIKVTTEKWLSPLGKSIEVDKVVPTLTVEFDTNKYSANPSYSNDNQLQKALEVLTY